MPGLVPRIDVLRFVQTTRGWPDKRGHDDCCSRMLGEEAVDERRP
jgi:hypothetical protein